LNLFPEKGKELGLQKKPFRADEIKGLRPVLDTKILKGDPHAFPQVDPGLSDGNLSTKRASQGVLQNLLVKGGIEEILKEEQAEADDDQNGDDDPEQGPFFSGVDSHFECNVQWQSPNTQRVGYGLRRSFNRILNLKPDCLLR
jgi:hypothetical protein